MSEFAWGMPWRIVALMTFNAKPTQPMIITRKGFSTASNHVSSVGKEETTRVLTLEADESLDSLQEDADAERQQENAVEKCAEEGGPLPAEGEAWRSIIALGGIAGRQSTA